MATRFTKSNKVGRKMLEESGMVANVCSVRTDVACGPCDAFGVFPAPVQTLVSKWVHLGHVSLIPRGFVVQLLMRIDGGSLWPGEASTETALEMMWEFQNAWEFVRYLDKGLVWALRFFTFSQSPRPVGVMQVSQCTVYELTPWPSGASRELVFWDGDRSIANAHRGAERQRIKDALVARKVLKPHGGFIYVSRLFF